MSGLILASIIAAIITAAPVPETSGSGWAGH